MSLYESFFTLIESSRRIVAFTGAGISTLSGIPDFRSAGGVYSKKFGSLNVEDILDIDFFMAHPEEYYAWAKTGWYGDEVYKPNIIHKVLKKMEDFGLLSEGVFTQNIDSLHTYCGSKKVYELHGTLRTSTCVLCGRKYTFDETKRRMENLAYPVCDCGGLLKSDIVFYGESLDGNILSSAYKSFGEADLAIVLGSSLVVNPAASLPYMTLQNGGKVVIVNRDRTYLDEQASFVFRDLREWGDEMDKFLEKRGQTIPS